MPLAPTNTPSDTLAGTSPPHRGAGRSQRSSQNKSGQGNFADHGRISLIEGCTTVDTEKRRSIPSRLLAAAAAHGYGLACRGLPGSGEPRRERQAKRILSTVPLHRRIAEPLTPAADR